MDDTLADPLAGRLLDGRYAVTTRIAHGGMIFALADTAFAYACNSRNVSTVAQQASIVFLAPAREGERLTAEAQEQSLPRLIRSSF